MTVKNGILTNARNARDYAEHALGVVLASLADIREAVDALDTRAESAWRRDDTQANGAGAATITFDGPRPGFDWRIERVTTVVVAGVNSIGTIYLGQAAPGLAVHVIADADFHAEDVGVPIFVASRTPVLVAITGAPANAMVTAALQVIETRTPE